MTEHQLASCSIFKEEEDQNHTLGWKNYGALFQIGDGCMLVDFMPRKETVIVIVVCSLQTLQRW
jgi:hypothetical protein